MVDIVGRQGVAHVYLDNLEQGVIIHTEGKDYRVRKWGNGTIWVGPAERYAQPMYDYPLRKVLVHALNGGDVALTIDLTEVDEEENDDAYHD